MDAGVGEAMLMSAAIGGAGSAAGTVLSGGSMSDALKSALTGAALGGVTGGLTSGGLSGLLGGAAPASGVGSSITGAIDAANGAGASLAGLPSEGSNLLLSGSNITPTAMGAEGASAGAGLGANGPSVGLGGTPSGGISSLGSNVAKVSPNIFGVGPQSNLALGALGAGSALTSAMAEERQLAMPPGIAPYTGILSKYDPYSALGVQYPTHMASGGIASLAMGGQPNQMYPMSQQDNMTFATPSQMPANAMAVRNFEPATNPMTGEPSQPMAEGGITSLGHFSDGGQLLKGPGDGMSDDIPAHIGQHQPARLADGEFVIPADVVSHLGNGSTDAGAKHLYAMMHKVRKARTGNPNQGKQIDPNHYLTA
jgi:hypothetical protein